MTRLPVTVVIPMRDCLNLLVPHLKQMECWQNRVEQIVVVDSSSTPDCMDYAKTHISHPGAQFILHPPGLYQSWNTGIALATTRYVYVSTVGDTITPAGLEHLVDVAERSTADVVTSPPSDPVASEDKISMAWPIAEFNRMMDITVPTVVDPMHAFLFSVTSLPKAILGSSASNLYATSFLRRYPFPTHLGRSGDVLLGLIASLEGVVVVTPQPCATYLQHPLAYSLKEYQVLDIAHRLLEHAIALWEGLGTNPNYRDSDVIQNISGMMSALFERMRRRLIADGRVKNLRENQARSWTSQLLFWQAQLHRDYARRRVVTMRSQIRRSLPTAVGTGVGG